MSDHKAEYYHLNSKLCKLIQARPFMYDRSARNYCRKEELESAWAEIAREVNDTVPSCKERWRNIRTAYARSVNIYKTSSGPNRHKRYYLHDELEFLLKHLNPTTPTIRVLTPSELDEQSNENCIYEITLDSSPSPTPIEGQYQEKIQEKEQVSLPEPPEPEPRLEPEPELAVKQEPEQNYLEESSQVRKRLRNNSQELPIGSKSQKTDPDSDFLNILLPEMKAMNSRQKILFKRKIFQALEEVFSDSRDFPGIEEPSVSQSSSPVPAAPRTYARRFLGNKNSTVRREKVIGEIPQTGRTPTMGQSVQSQVENITIKLEIDD